MHFQGTWFAYYGQSDSTLGVATYKVGRDVRRPRLMFDLGDPAHAPLARGRGRPAARVRPRLAPPRRRVRLARRRRRARARPAGRAVDHLPDDARLLPRATCWAGPDCAALADHGVAALRGPVPRPAITAAGTPRSARRPDRPPTRRPTSTRSSCSPAPAPPPPAGPAGASCSTRRCACCSSHFWDDEFGMVVEQWDESFTTLDGYRGVNANMHTVEALLSAADVLDDASLRDRAQRILDPGRARPRAAQLRGGSPSTSTPTGRRCSTTTSTSRRTRSGPTAPPSATGSSGPGWRCTCAPASGDAAPDWLLDDAAVAVRRRRSREGWAVDGADGFVYTVDWDGRARRTRADALGRRRGHRHRRRPARRDRRPVVRRLVRDLVAAHRRPASATPSAGPGGTSCPRPTSRAASPGRASRTPTTPSRPR